MIRLDLTQRIVGSWRRNLSCLAFVSQEPRQPVRLRWEESCLSNSMECLFRPRLIASRSLSPCKNCFIPVLTPHPFPLPNSCSMTPAPAAAAVSRVASVLNPSTTSMLVKPDWRASTTRLPTAASSFSVGMSRRMLEKLFCCRL